MHARELVELAALLASHGSVLTRNTSAVVDSGLQAYWSAARCRLDDWAKTLHLFHEARRNPRPQRCRQLWPDTKRTLEEILASEVLTRVWTGVARSIDQHYGAPEWEPIASATLAGHLEARNRSLRLLASGAIDRVTATQLNRLRHRAESWTDRLLAYLLETTDVKSLAFDPERSEDFSQGLQRERDQSRGHFTWPLILSSLRTAFDEGSDRIAANPLLNEQVAAGVLSCFGPDTFDSISQFQGLWQIRLMHVASDTQSLIDQLLAEESS